MAGLDMAVAELGAETLQEADLLVGQVDLFARDVLFSLHGGSFPANYVRGRQRRWLAAPPHRIGWGASWARPGNVPPASPSAFGWIEGGETLIIGPLPAAPGGACINTVLSDNGRKYRGRPDRHPYELFLQLEDIEHRTTKVRRPQSNGYVERLHRTLLEEHFRVMRRIKFYESLDEIQKDLDAYRLIYNTKQPHQGRNTNCRTPATVFATGLPKPETTTHNAKEDKPKKSRLNYPNPRTANVR